MIDNSTLRDIVQNAPDTVLSLYLNVNPASRKNQNTPRGWEIFLKNALSDLKSEHGESDVWKDIRKRTETFFEGYQNTGKSLILFVGEGDYLESYEVPVELENHYAYGEPDVVRLLWALDEFERYLVVLVDSEQAYFHSAYLGEDTQSESMSIDFEAYDFGEHNFIQARSTGRTTGEELQGGGPDDFEDMKDEHIRRFHSDVAERIREIMRDGEQNRIILGGIDKAANAVKDLLHESIRPKVGAILSVPVKSETHEIADAIRDTANNLERSYEMDMIEEVVNFAKSGGRGALGQDDVSQAFQMQQVETLILPYPMEDSDLAAEMTLKALELGSEVEMVHGSAASRLQQEADGIAARLYYSINEPEQA